jgi:hypothetical protein
MSKSNTDIIEHNPPRPPANESANLQYVVIAIQNENIVLVCCCLLSNVTSYYKCLLTVSLEFLVSTNPSMLHLLFKYREQVARRLYIDFVFEHRTRNRSHIILWVGPRDLLKQHSTSFSGKTSTLNDLMLDYNKRVCISNIIDTGQCTIPFLGIRVIIISILT